MFDIYFCISRVWKFHYSKCITMYFRIIYVITDFVIHFAEHVKDNVYLYSYIKNPLITPKQLFDYFILWIRLLDICMYHSFIQNCYSKSSYDIIICWIKFQQQSLVLHLRHTIDHFVFSAIIFYVMYLPNVRE